MQWEVSVTKFVQELLEKFINKIDEVLVVSIKCFLLHQLHGKMLMFK